MKDKSFEILSRNLKIDFFIIGKSFKVYNGRVFYSVFVSESIVGFRFGEFSFTRVRSKSKKKLFYFHMGQKVHSKGFRFGQNTTIFISKGKLYPFRFLNNEKLVGFNNLNNKTSYGDFQQKHLQIKKIISFFFRINQLYINNISLLQTISGLFIFIEFYKCRDSKWVLQNNKFKVFISLIKKHFEILFNNSIPIFFFITELTAYNNLSLPFSSQALRFKGGQDLFRCLYLIQFFPLSKSLAYIIAKSLEQNANQQNVLSFLKTVLDFIFYTSSFQYNQLKLG